MFRYKLLAGRHQQKEDVLDLRGRPVPNNDGTPKRESKTYQRGDVFFSESALHKLNAPGAIKFQLLDENPEWTLRDAQMRGVAVAPSAEPKAPAAPGGQVSSGIQRTTGAVLEQTTPAAFEAQVAKDAAARKRVAPGSKTKIEPASRPASGTRTPTVASGPPRVTATLEGARSGTPSNVLKE